MASTIPATLRATAARYPDQDAVVDGPVRLSYQDLDRAVLDTVRALTAMGVSPGERVAVWAQNCWQWCVACLGITAAGAVLVPINTRFRGREAAYLMEDSGAVVLFTTTGFLGADYPAMLRDAAPWSADLPVVVMDGDTAAGDLSWEAFLAAGSSVSESDAVARLEGVRPDQVSDIMYTSGTTGFPKGVVQTHGKNIVAMRALAGAVGLTSSDRNLVLAPMFAQFGLRCGLFIDLIEGATSVIDSVFDVARIIDIVERERITFLPGPPTILAAMLSPLAQGRDISSLRLTLTGSTVIPEELVIDLQEGKVFDHVLTAYGLTEACGPVTVSSLEDSPAQVSTYAGRALDHVRIRVVDPDSGATLGPNERGEFLVHSPTVMDGYLNDPAGTASAITPGGWLRTGDIGLLTEQGYLQVTGRLKDMVIVGGMNVYPAEVENTIRENAAVRDVALIGIADDRLGEVGAAFIVPEAGSDFDPGALHAWCREVLANYKVPRLFVAVDALPLNSSLKVDKPALRERARELGHQVAAG